MALVMDANRDMGILMGFITSARSCSGISPAMSPASTGACHEISRLLPSLDCLSQAKGRINLRWRERSCSFVRLLLSSSCSSTSAVPRVPLPWAAAVRACLIRSNSLTREASRPSVGIFALASGFLALSAPICSTSDSGSAKSSGISRVVGAAVAGGAVSINSDPKAALAASPLPVSKFVLTTFRVGGRILIESATAELREAQEACSSQSFRGMLFFTNALFCGVGATPIISQYLVEYSSSIAFQ
mmetsp:Transcript_128661/g.293748  ORF Transcript_128661/g.293748 Transcript_128661/m.293748 type:complete len:245 (-) Transcript_128661:109-843(-)